MRFTKTQALGDDFIILESLEDELDISTSSISKLCTRHFGIGANGLIIVRESDRAEYYMDYFNPNGERAEMCGDGLRCFVLYLFQRGLVKTNEFDVETPSGRKSVGIKKSGRGKKIWSNMGAPILDPEEIPIAAPGDPLRQIIEVKDKKFTGRCISVGNPHCVIEVEGLENFPVQTYGPLIENLSLFPAKANVEFVSVENTHEIHMRTWERDGHGEPLSCGSGSSAAVAALTKLGITDSGVIVHQRGGDLRIDIEEDESIIMDGPAEIVFTGEIDQSFFRGST